MQGRSHKLKDQSHIRADRSVYLLIKLFFISDYSLRSLSIISQYISNSSLITNPIHTSYHSPLQLPLPLQLLHPPHHHTRLDPLGPIGIHKTPLHNPVSPHEKRRRDRHLHTRITITLLKIMSQLLKHGSHFLRLLEQDTEFTREHIADIGEHFELQAVFFDGAEGLVWDLGGDGKQFDGVRGEEGEVRLQRVQREVAEGTPGPAVEGYEEGRAEEQRVDGDGGSEGVGEGAVREGLPGLEGEGGGEGLLEVGVAFVDGVFDVGGCSGLEVSGYGGELGGERHAWIFGGVCLVV